MTLRSRLLQLHPATLVLTSFLLTILLGMVILKLPISTRTGSIGWLDALFTATSAVCVTGLVVVDTGSYFSLFGQTVLLVLIQIGGLGVMTVSVALFRWLGRSLSIHSRMAMQDLFAHTPRDDIYSLIRSILFFTLGMETLGAILLTFYWSGDYAFPQALRMGIFHSVSAFCNAGFALFPDSLMQYSDSLFINLTICSLIVVGGIGFPVLYDLQTSWKQRRRKRIRLTVQTKTVLWTTLFLIISGALMFAALEWETFAQSQPMSHRLLAPLFQSITCRTAGFNTVDIGSLREATLAMMMFLMFIGASPGSCGGGVKTTTFALLTLFTITRIRKVRRVNMFKKSIPVETVTRTISLVLISIGIIAVVLFLLLVGDSSGRANDSSRITFIQYFFETVSAFGTVGLSMGVTAALSSWAKTWIILTMIIGRVGVLTFSYIIIGSGTTQGIEYSEENLMIG